MGKNKATERFRITEHTNPSGTKSWRVSGTMPDGQRVRRNFSNKAEAISERGRLEMKAEGAPEAHRALKTTLSQAQLSDAEAATQLAGNQKLSKVVNHYLAINERAKSMGASLDSAISFFESHYRPESREITIYNAYREFIGTRAGLSPKTLVNYERILRELLKPDPNKMVHSYNVADIEEITSRYDNLNTRKTLRRVFSVFFNWAVRHHYCLENPCERLDRLPKDSSRIVVLSIDEVQRLLYAAVNYREGITAAPVAIALFAGLRPSELADLHTKDIKDDMIIVRGGKKRRSGNRRVPISGNLKTWLEEFPFKGLPKGWDHKLKLLKAATDAKRWVQDILRHTSISHQAERDRDEARTAFNNGTSKDMMDRHYRDMIEDQDDLITFWSLTPAIIRKKDLQVELPKQVRIAWPPKAKIKELIEKFPITQAAAKIGVTDNGLRKHCKKIGINISSSRRRGRG